MSNLPKNIFVTTLGLLASSLAFNTFANQKTQTISINQISSKTSYTLATAALKKCSNDGYRVSATVVDLSGNVLAQLRADQAGVHTLESSRKKAFTAMSMKRPSGELMTLIAEKPLLKPLQNMDDNLLFLAGGLPIQVNGNVIGAIGVGGAPGGHLDVACAESAIKAAF